MTAVRVQQRASHQIDEIYLYTLQHWGKNHADSYIHGLFDSFERIARHAEPSRPIPAELGVAGYCYRYQKHFIYWKILRNGDIGIVTILHERMHQIDRLRQGFGL